ncbi:hypothetical protein Bca52824_045178 [Brassica carinata]|uniref:Uncharacterized protein n=1 Tax=Brassica carinata TaxID=52824 RepID=A0A8X7RAG4_BRACI|nr:hypothetical protein Bca52824_045178 [Brassica carinata]
MAALPSSATIFYSPSLTPFTAGQRSLSSPTRIRSSPRVLRGFHSLRHREFHCFSQNATAGGRFNSFSCNCLSAVSTTTLDYEVIFGD